jgi:D-3-phosphoglycerate dehydrogenase
MIGDGFTDYEVRAKGAAAEFWAFTQHVVRPSVVERADRVLVSFEEIEVLAGSIS